MASVIHIKNIPDNDGTAPMSNVNGGMSDGNEVKKHDHAGGRDLGVLTLSPFHAFAREGHIPNGRNIKKDGSGKNHKHAHRRPRDNNEEINSKPDKDIPTMEDNGHAWHKNAISHVLRIKNNDALENFGKFELFILTMFFVLEMTNKSESKGEINVATEPLDGTNKDHKPDT